jgi:cyclopropane fatty-acyl-phospholipid synthase-like methyltransferase
MKIDLTAVESEYERLRGRLGKAGWISPGYVQDRGPGAGGPCYQWTRKVRGKTVSVALSKEQYEAMREAIEGWREVEAILDQMQKLTRQRIFGTLPDTRRRKPLTKKVLGLI